MYTPVCTYIYMYIYIYIYTHTRSDLQEHDLDSDMHVCAEVYAGFCSS